MAFTIYTVLGDGDSRAAMSGLFITELKFTHVNILVSHYLCIFSEHDATHSAMFFFHLCYSYWVVE